MVLPCVPTHSSADGHLGHSPSLTLGNSAAWNIHVRVLVQTDVLISPGQTARSRIAGACGILVVLGGYTKCHRPGSETTSTDRLPVWRLEVQDPGAGSVGFF